MSLQAVSTPRFLRKTRLGPDEYRKNFYQIDRDVLTLLTSPEADRVTPLMSKIYLRLVSAPERFWESEGVLRVKSEVRDEKLLKAWAVLCELTGVASATASKAVAWMREQGIIGYFSGKNGVGLRIFLNRAASSVGSRPARAGQKILAFAPASSGRGVASTGEPAFNDSFADPEVLDLNIKSRAPKNGADDMPVGQTSSAHAVPDASNSRTSFARDEASRLREGTGFARGDTGFTRDDARGAASLAEAASLDEVVVRLRGQLEPALRAAAREAARQEHERTREWLEKSGLPKAARVAQREAYDVLRKHGVLATSGRDARASAAVGRGCSESPTPQPLSADDVAELAGACVALLETRGQEIELTLSQMRVDAGGFLLPEDAGRVREKARSLLAGDKDGGGG